MSRQLTPLQARINERQSELHRVADILAKEAYRLRRRGGLNRVILIALGALTATQAGLEHLLPIPKPILGLIFLLLGVFIAVIAGLEAAFKFESRGAELNSLAASCHSVVRQAASLWSRLVGSEEDLVKQVDGT